MALITLKQQLYDQIQKNQSYFEDSIVPLHRYETNYQPFIGSSIYLKLHDHYFIVTANHVAEDLTSRYCIPVQNHLDNVLNFYSVANNPFDFSFAKLNSKLDFFKPIDFTDCQRYEGKRTGYLIASGFPETKVDSFKEKVKCILECIVTKEASEKEYEEIEAKRETNIVIRFETNKLERMHGVRTQLPFPNGMSGGGLFFLPNTIMYNDVKPKLVGLLTRWGAHNNKNIVATRIEVILFAIRTIYKELNSIEI